MSNFEVFLFTSAVQYSLFDILLFILQ